MGARVVPSGKLGPRIRLLRELRGIKREQFALSLNMSAENWRHYEAGRYHVTADMLPILAELLDMPLGVFTESLFEDQAEPDNMSQTGLIANCNPRTLVSAIVRPCAPVRRLAGALA